MQLKTVESSSKNSLHVRFRTSSTDGLLFLAAGETDFLWVALQAGRIQVRGLDDLYASVSKITTSCKIVDIHIL